MPDERESPSGGWREVYREMAVSTDHEAVDCPECGHRATRVRVDTYWCPAHGVLTAG